MHEREDFEYPLAEVRGHRNKDQNGKLLFTLVENRYGISILLKRKGETETYCIPLFVLLEPFAADCEELRRCTRLGTYERQIEESREQAEQ